MSHRRVAKTKAFKVRVTADLKQSIAQMADARGCDESDLIRQAIIEFLARQPASSYLTPTTDNAHLNEAPPADAHLDTQRLAGTTRLIMDDVLREEGIPPSSAKQPPPNAPQSNADPEEATPPSTPSPQQA